MRTINFSNLCSVFNSHHGESKFVSLFASWNFFQKEQHFATGMEERKSQVLNIAIAWGCKNTLRISYSSFFLLRHFYRDITV